MPEGWNEPLDQRIRRVVDEQPDNPLLRAASCVIGLALSGHAMIDPYQNYIDGEPLEEWATWVGLEGLGGALTLYDCWRTWVADRGNKSLASDVPVDVRVTRGRQFKTGPGFDDV